MPTNRFVVGAPLPYWNHIRLDQFDASVYYPWDQQLVGSGDHLAVYLQVSQMEFHLRSRPLSESITFRDDEF